MCGIAGIISLDREAVSAVEIKYMTDALKHRGPDGEGIWTSHDKRIGVGHRRLAIVDVSQRGAQPMGVGDYTITFNGEIYNHKELKKELQDQGRTFATNTDTEVIVKAYEHYGPSCLQKFDGAFAFVIYGSKSRKVFAARDRFGEKPFYYYKDKDRLIFGSEMKALWSVGVPKQLRESAIFDFYMHCRPYKSDTGSSYEGVYQLRAGHYVESSIDQMNWTQTRYWDLAIDKQVDISKQAAIDRFNTLLDRSLSRRIDVPVPYGYTLSGGLDSSLLVCKGATIYQGKINTFSASYPGYAIDEGYYQEKVVKKVGSTHRMTSPSASKCLDVIDEVLHYQEEPIASGSPIMQYEVYRLASQSGMKVLVDGQGADESLSGYPGFTLTYLQELLSKRKLIKYIRTAVQAKQNQAGSYGYYLGGGMAHLLPKSLTDRFRSGSSSQAAKDLQTDFLTCHNQEDRSNKRALTLEEDLKGSMINFGLDQLLRYSDRSCMAHSIEVRLPYLSHELVEFLFTLPSVMKINNGWSKWIARAASTQVVPQEIVWRKDKVGFEGPDTYLQTMRDDPRISDVINSNAVKQYFVDRDVKDPHLFFRKYMISKLIMQQNN